MNIHSEFLFCALNFCLIMSNILGERLGVITQFRKQGHPVRFLCTGACTIRHLILPESDCYTHRALILDYVYRVSAWTRYKDTLLIMYILCLHRFATLTINLTN